MRFRCTKCGICCGDTKEKTRHILLLRTEAEQIATATLQPISEFTARIRDKAPYSYEMKKTEDGKCVFLENNCCTIYAVRPLICKFYPFELRMAYRQKYTFFYTSECLGINKGPMLSKNYFRKLFRMARAESLQTVDSKRESWFSIVQLEKRLDFYCLSGYFKAFWMLSDVFGCTCIHICIRTHKFCRPYLKWGAVCDHPFGVFLVDFSQSFCVVKSYWHIPLS